MNKSKIIFFNKTKKGKNKMSKYMVYFFKILHIFLGLDFGFFTLKKTGFVSTKCLSLIYAVTFTSVCIFLFWHYLTFIYAVWYSSYLLIYLIQVIILLFTKENTFYFLQNVLLSIDTELGVNSSSYNMEIKIIVTSLAVIMYKVTFSIIYCGLRTENCVQHIVASILFYVPLIAIDVVLVVYFFVFYTIYGRVQKIVSFVENNKFSTKTCQFIYKSLLKCAENVINDFSRVFLVALLFTTPNTMLSIFYMIKDIQTGMENEKVDTLGDWIAVSSIVNSLVLIFAPTIAAGLLSSQGDKLKSALYDRMIDENDLAESQQIEKLSRYIEARPLKFTICKILKLDCSFPVVILNVCVTYLIVLLQFSHMY